MHRNFSLFFCLFVLGFYQDIPAAELRVAGINNNTLALTRVSSDSVAPGDVYVVLAFEQNWFREIGRFRVMKVLDSGVIGHVISSPKPPSEWYNKVAIPETAWDSETYQQWQRSSGGAGMRDGPNRQSSPRSDPPRLRNRGRSVPDAVPRTVRASGHSTPLIWDRIGWAKWVLYAVGAGSGATAFYFHHKAQNARDDVGPENLPEVNDAHIQDAEDYEQIRNLTGWTSLGMLVSGIVLHEWELADRNRQKQATVRLEVPLHAGYAGVGYRIAW